MVWALAGLFVGLGEGGGGEQPTDIPLAALY